MNDQPVAQGPQSELTGEIKRLTNQLIAINAVTSVIGMSQDLNTSLETALLVVMDMIGAEASIISLIAENRDELVLRAHRGLPSDAVPEGYARVTVGETLSGKAIEEDDVFVHNHLDGSEHFAFVNLNGVRFKSIAIAPMHARGKIIGLLSIMSKKNDSFDVDTVNVLRVVADTVGTAVDNVRLYGMSLDYQRHLETIIHSTADGIIATDPTGNISLVNFTAERMLGVRQHRLMGMPIREAPLPFKIRDSLRKVLASHAEGGNQVTRVTLDDDRVIALLATPIETENLVEQDAPADSWVIVLQDVTHHREEQIERARFVRAAAHDMRNPLSVTYNGLVVLQRLLRSEDENIQEIIDLSMSGIERLREMINDVLALEQLESRHKFNPQPVNLDDLVTELKHDAINMIDDRLYDFSIQVEPNLSQVKADMHWLKRALTNYLDNAFKYTPPGSKVMMKIFKDDNSLHIEVIDDGPGIPIAAQPRLFERFFRIQTKSEEQTLGTGLGLAIVQAVAEAHDGSVYAQSTPGSGSTFGIILPL